VGHGEMAMMMDDDHDDDDYDDEKSMVMWKRMANAMTEPNCGATKTETPFSIYPDYSWLT
jgi:hypothetical protein